MKNMVIGVSGITLYLFSFLICFSVFGAFQVVRGFVVSEINVIVLILGLLIFGLMVIYLVRYLISKRILLTDTELVLNSWKSGLYSGKEFTPTTEKSVIKVENIAYVLLGEAVYFENLAIKENNYFLMKQLSIIKNTIFNRTNISAISHSPLIYILQKDDKQDMLGTKLYSKKNCENLLKELKSRGINVIIQDNIISID